MKKRNQSALQIASLKKPMSSIIRGLFGVIDHEDLHGTFLRFESETELLLEG